VSFFDAVPAPEPPRPPDHRPPPWLAPPDNVLPGAAPLEVLLARRDGLAVWIGGALAYPEGVSFGLLVVRRDPAETRWGPASRPFMLPPEPGGPRFGVGFADGRRAVLGGPPAAPGAADPASGAVLTTAGGGGSDRRWEWRMWLWPLPPGGPLTFALAWEDEGIEETTAVADADALIAAAGRAVELWPDDRPPGASTGHVLGWAP
jgi:hypothetical protein